MILNPGRPARAITILRIGPQFAIAAADAHFDPALSTSQFVFTVSIYTVTEAAMSPSLGWTTPRSARLTGGKSAHLPP